MKLSKSNSTSLDRPAPNEPDPGSNPGSAPPASRVADTAELARIFKALSDPNRLAILQMLRDRCGGSCRFEAGDNGNTVSAIAECCDIALSTVSHHLKELKNAGLIECVKRGQWVYCSPRPEMLARVRDFIEA